MKKKNIPEYSDEIDLLGILITVWEKKFKVIFIAIFTVMIMFIFQITRYDPIYIATTEIRPISSTDELSYKTYNRFTLRSDNFKRFNKLADDDLSIEEIKTLEEIEKQTKNLNPETNEIMIDKDFLLKLFVEKLKENTDFENGIKKFNLISKENYTNSQEYEDEVKRLASTIEFLPPNKDKKKGEIELYWRINFITKNLKSWQDILKTINGPVNEQIRLHLINQHRLSIEIKERVRRFNIEDIEIKMKNALINYDNVTSRKLAYLEEQAKIARKLGVANNNYLEPQNINTGNALVTTLIAKTPDYLRGYEMIEEEISLIKKRINKEAFIENFSLLESIKKDYSTNKDAERLEELFQSTPVVDPNNFYAAKLMHQSTITDTINYINPIKLIILFSLIGLIVGSFYVLIENAIIIRNKLQFRK